MKMLFSVLWTSVKSVMPIRNSHIKTIKARGTEFVVLESYSLSLSVAKNKMLKSDRIVSLCSYTLVPGQITVRWAVHLSEWSLMWSSPSRLSVPYSGLCKRFSPCSEVFGVFLGGDKGYWECLCSWLVQRLLMCNTGHFSIQMPGAIL